jgi:hypothetical protein
MLKSKPTAFVINTIFQQPGDQDNDAHENEVTDKDDDMDHV